MANNDKQEKLSYQEAWDFRTFMSEVTNIMNGYFTPDLREQALIGLNNNSLEPTYNKVIQALCNAVDNQKNLQAFTEWTEWADSIFKRMVQYYSNLLSFDLMITCTNATKKDYGTEAYKKDYKKVCDFLDGFDYKYEFRKVIKQIMRTETDYVWLRHNEDIKNTAYTLQVMPQSYCKLTGYWEKGLLYDFDMNYFLQPSVDIDGFDTVFKTLFNKMFNDGKVTQSYNPMNNFNNRNGSFALWHQTSPLYQRKERGAKKLISGAWAFKFDMGNFAQVPFLSSVLKDAILNIPIQQLQYDKDVLSARAMLVGEIGMMNSMNERDAMAMSPTTLGKFLSYIRNAIGKHVAVGAMPAKDVDLYQFEDKNEGMYANQSKSVASSGMSASRLIYNSDKMSQEEMRNAILTDYNIMKNLYSQFNNFLNYYVNQLTTRFKFDFQFTGSNYNFERKDRQEFLMKLADKGIVLNSSAFASAFGINPVTFDRMLEQTASEDSWLNNLSTLQSVYTQSGKNSEGKSGRPLADDVSTESREYDYSD